MTPAAPGAKGCVCAGVCVCSSVFSGKCVHGCQRVERQDGKLEGKHNLMFEDKAGTEAEDKQGEADGKKS